MSQASASSSQPHQDEGNNGISNPSNKAESAPKRMKVSHTPSVDTQPVAQQSVSATETEGAPQTIAEQSIPASVVPTLESPADEMQSATDQHLPAVEQSNPNDKVIEQLIPPEKIKQETDQVPGSDLGYNTESNSHEPNLAIVKQEIKVEPDAETDSCRDSDADTDSEPGEADVPANTNGEAAASNATGLVRVKQETVDPEVEDKEDEVHVEQKMLWLRKMDDLLGEIIRCLLLGFL